MNMQEKIMAAIKKIAEAAGLEFVVNYTACNVGRVYIQFKDEFESKFSFHFDFQTSYCALQFYPTGVEPIGTVGFTHENCIRDYHIQYNDSLAITVMLKDVTDWSKPDAVLPAPVGRRR